VDLAAVDSDASGKTHVPLRGRQLVELLQCRSNLDGGTHCTQRIVLVQLRHSENGHDGVADELLDRAAVSLDRRADRGEVAFQQHAIRLRVEPRSQRRRLDEIAKKDGDRPAVGRTFDLSFVESPERGILLEDRLL
jgi:hypothetical protein